MCWLCLGLPFSLATQQVDSPCVDLWATKSLWSHLCESETKNQWIVLKAEASSDFRSSAGSGLSSNWMGDRQGKSGTSKGRLEMLPTWNYGELLLPVRVDYIRLGGPRVCLKLTASCASERLVYVRDVFHYFFKLLAESVFSKSWGLPQIISHCDCLNFLTTQS